VNPLTFARDLARLQRELEYLAHDGQESVESAAIAESYLHLLGRLAEIDGGEVIAGLVAEAVGAYDAAVSRWRPFREAAWRREEARRQQLAAEHEEALRRHKIAVTVECPFCGASPGKVCYTVPTTDDGEAHTKGVHDHADRYRAATGQHGPPSDPEAEL
jgi:hypothetical protein